MRNTSIQITDVLKKELDNIRAFLTAEYGVSMSYQDAVSHLIKFWNERKSDRGPDRKETAQP